MQCTGPYWPGGLKSAQGQWASAYVEGCIMQIEFICFLNFDSSTCHSRDIQLLVTEILPVFVTLFVFKKWFKNRCHGLRVYPVCVCNTVRLGQDTTWNRRVHGLRVYPVCVCNTVRLELSRMDSVTIKPSHSIRCVYRADLILLQIVDWSSKEVCPTILINKSEDNLH